MGTGPAEGTGRQEGGDPGTRRDPEDSWLVGCRQTALGCRRPHETALAGGRAGFRPAVDPEGPPREPGGQVRGHPCSALVIQRNAGSLRLESR